MKTRIDTDVWKSVFNRYTSGYGQYQNHPGVIRKFEGYFQMASCILLYYFLELNPIYSQQKTLKNWIVNVWADFISSVQKLAAIIFEHNNES